MTIFGWVENAMNMYVVTLLVLFVILELGMLTVTMLLM